MTKKFQILIGLMMVFALAACSNDKDNEETSAPKNETPAVAAEESANENEVNEEEKEKAEDEEDENELADDESIGVTMEEFTKVFNEKSAEANLDFTIGDMEWEDTEQGLKATTIELHEDIHLNGLVKEDGGDLKAILLEVGGYESREQTIGLVQAIIESANPNVSDAETKGLLKELGLSDPKQDGDDSEKFIDKNGLQYLLSNESGNWLEFMIGNQNDPDIMEILEG